MRHNSNIKIMDNVKTAVIYSRVSTSDQSNAEQLRKLEEWCISQGINVVGRFQEKVSGANPDKEELNKLLDSEPMADLLVIREVSRLSREENYNIAYNKLQILLQKYSIYVLLDDLFLERGKIDLASDIMMMIKLFGAADERKKIRDRTSTAIKRYKETSILNVISGNQGFGLMKAPNPNFKRGINTRNIWVKNPNEWDKVLKIWELRTKGVSILKIAQIMNINNATIRQVFDSKIIRYYMEQDHKELFYSGEEKKFELTTVKAPSKHVNNYSGKIFYLGTNKGLIHQLSARGARYKLKNGGITIKESIINDCVKITLNEMMEFFGLKQEELSKENTQRIKELEELIKGLKDSNVSLQKQVKQIAEKIARSISIEVEEILNSDLLKVKKQIENNTNQIKLYEEEKTKLETIDYNKIELKIDDSNLPNYINKYISFIEVGKESGFNVIVKVEIKREYIPINYFNFKLFRVFNHRGATIEEIGITGETGRTTSKDGKKFWSMRIPDLEKFQYDTEKANKVVENLPICQNLYDGISFDIENPS